MQEIWKDIVGYEGTYQVSNKGRVKNILPKNGKLLSTYSNNRGYIGVHLYKNSKCKNFLVHRLVAQAFIENPLNLPQVNHKDEDKNNNCVDNLEWCTNTYNRHYGTSLQRMKKSKGKHVLQYTLDGKFVAEYDSIIDVERKFGFDHSSICKCCLGKYSQHKGFIWKYA